MSTTMLTILTYIMKWKTKTKMRTSKPHNMVPKILILTKKMTKKKNNDTFKSAPDSETNYIMQVIQG